MLDVSGLCKRYLPGPGEPVADRADPSAAASLALPAARWLAHNLHLQVAPGQTVAVLGASGSGKSTLLAMLAGLEEPDAGRVCFDGEDVTHWPPERRRFALMFQDFALFPHLNVQDNVAFALVEQRVPKAQARSQAVAMLARFGLADRALSGVTQLSGGEQQRVALARALAPRPQLMLLDEPFSNLDVDLRERLAHEVRGILKAAGATALFVTHDQFEAFAIGDVIGVMNEGHLHQCDDAYTLYHRPATRFVADFIGHGVFAPATLVQRGNNVVAQPPLGELTDLDECPLPGSYPGGECDVLLRADDIVHDDHAPVQAQIVRK